MAEKVAKTKTKTPEKRIEFLAKKFQVFDEEDLGDIEIHSMSPECYHCVYDIDETGDQVMYALYNWNKRMLKNEGTQVVGSVMVYEDVFVNIVQADPTEHKEYTQWMLQTFVNLVKKGDNDFAVRFVTEDLYLAAEYLEVFHAEKHKPKFKAICSKNLAFKDIKDTSDINQYRDLSQLFDAVDPFILKDTSKLEKDIRLACKLGNGEIPYEDRKIMIFYPKTHKGTQLFSSFTNWCTKTKSTFDSYDRRKTSTGTKTRLYIIIPKTFFIPEGHSDATTEIYQFHFESSQFMNKADKGVKDEMEGMIADNVGLSDYFYNLLIEFARANHGDYQNNVYVKALKLFGFHDVVFEVIPPDIEKIQFLDENLGDMKGIGRFNKAYSLYLRDCVFSELPESLGDLQNLGYLALPNNKIEKLPSSIGRLKNLTTINISGNPIKVIPENIKGLDSSNGGNLELISYSNLSSEVLERLRILLPNVKLNEFKGLTT
jgi:hypothetical protein